MVDEKGSRERLTADTIRHFHLSMEVLLSVKSGLSQQYFDTATESIFTPFGGKGGTYKHLKATNTDDPTKL